MNQLDKWEALWLWTLLVEGGVAYRPELQRRKLLPSNEKQISQGLQRAGLLIRENRAGQGAGLWLEVTDQGWATALDHFDTELPDSKLAAKVLRAWLIKLQAFARAKDLPLAELLAPSSPIVSPDPPISDTVHSGSGQDSPDLRARIRAAYLEVTGGAFGARALLSDLRARLPEVPRATLDAALLQLHRNEDGTQLMRLDNPREITAAVQAARLDFGGEPLHLLWIER